MVKIEIGDRKIEIRPLTRGEVKGLKDYGFGDAVCIPTYDQDNNAYEKTIKIVLGKKDLDYLFTRPLPDTKKVFTEILKETYGAADEEKNSQSTSSGSMTKPE